MGEQGGTLAILRRFAAALRQRRTVDVGWLNGAAETPPLAGSARFGAPAQFSEGPAQISFDFELTVVGLELGRRSENAGPKRVTPLVAEPCTNNQRKPAGGVFGSRRLVLEAQRNIRFELIEFVGCLAAQLEQTEPHNVRKWRDTAQN